MRIGIDMDDTICDTWEILVGYFCDYFHFNFEKTLYNQDSYLGLLNLIGKDKYVEFERYIIEDVTLQLPLKDNVQEVIKELSREHEIVFITARNDTDYDTPYKVSKEYLDSHGIYYDKLIIDAVDKGTVCKEEQIDLFIDDRVSNCRAARRENINVLMFGTKFNMDSQEFRKANSWLEVKEYVDSLKEG